MAASGSHAVGEVGGGARADGEIDWERAERSPEFREAVARRRRFVIPATVFYLAWFLGFVLLAGYAEDFMGTEIVNGFNVGYALGLSQIVMTWVLCAMYLRKADRDFDPLREKAAARAVEAIGAEGRPRRRPFEGREPERPGTVGNASTGAREVTR